MSGSRPLVRRSSKMPLVPTRRAGLAERRLITPEDSQHQNMVLIDADSGAEVELHPVSNSESFFILRGEVEVFGDGWSELLGPGDSCYFPPGMEHGARVPAGSAQFLIVFAPCGVSRAPEPPR